MIYTYYINLFNHLHCLKSLERFGPSPRNGDVIHRGFRLIFWMQQRLRAQVREQGFVWSVWSLTIRVSEQLQEKK